MSREKTLGQIAEWIHQKAPTGTAEQWDNVGLLLGDPSWKTESVVIADDLSPAALDLAKKSGAKLIVTHHPCIFPTSRGLSRLVAGRSGSLSRVMLECLHHGVGVLACHTNFDQCALEVCEEFSKAFGFRPLGRFVDSAIEKLVFTIPATPKDHFEKVREAICEAGAGKIGRYDFCTFRSDGVGSFRGGEGTQPAVGESGKLEEVSELRVETVVPCGLRAPVVQALLQAHPYEEVSYDIIKLEQKPTGRALVSGIGYGVFGEFDQPKPFSELARRVKATFQVNGYWVTQPPASSVKRIGFVAGKGASFLSNAVRQRCDLFITGEAGYHAALTGSRSGLTVLEVGHRQSERWFLSVMGSWIRDWNLEALVLDEMLQAFET